MRPSACPVQGPVWRNARYRPATDPLHICDRERSPQAFLREWCDLGQKGSLTARSVPLSPMARSLPPATSRISHCLTLPPGRVLSPDAILVVRVSPGVTVLEFGAAATESQRVVDGSLGTAGEPGEVGALQQRAAGTSGRGSAAGRATRCRSCAFLLPVWCSDDGRGVELLA